MEKNPRERLNLKKEVRTFGLSFGLGMGILTGLGLWHQWPQGVWMTTAGLSVFHLVLAPFVTKPLLPTFYTVTTLGKGIGHLIFTLVFTLVYYLLYTPISWILRLAGKDHIARDFAVPHWKDYPKEANDPKRIEKLY